MNLDNLSSADYPFKHWEISKCLDVNALDEISYSNIPDGDRAYDDFQVPVASASLKHKLHEDSKRQLRRKVLNSVINEMNKHDQLHYRAQIEEPVRLTLHYERVGEETSIELESEFGQKSQRIFTDSDLYDFGAESIFYSWLENTLKTFI